VIYGFRTLHLTGFAIERGVEEIWCDSNGRLGTQHKKFKRLRVRD
jgi:hypothetical protein